MQQFAKLYTGIPVRWFESNILRQGAQERPFYLNLLNRSLLCLQEMKLYHL